MMLKNGYWWPDDDKECWPRLYEVADIQFALQYVKNRDTAVQAGGNCGQWPIALATEGFKSVYTFEPDPNNFECLLKNVAEKSRQEVIHAYGVGLGAVPGGKASLTKWENNAGAHYITPDSTDGDVNLVCIDELKLEACDLLILDIEGFEPFALRGAEETIKKFSPVIMFEEKGLSERYDCPKGTCERYLQQFGYKVKKAIHRDLIMVRM